MWCDMTREMFRFSRFHIVWGEIVIFVYKLIWLGRERGRWARRTVWILILVRHDEKVGAVVVDERECSAPRNEVK